MERLCSRKPASRCAGLPPCRAGQNLLLALNYVHHGESRLVCEAHEKWGERFQVRWRCPKEGWVGGLSGGPGAAARCAKVPAYAGITLAAKTARSLVSLLSLALPRPSRCRSCTRSCRR